MTPRRTLSALVCLAALVLGLAACGGNESGFGDLPACGDIWVDGNTLPSDYAGCVDGDVGVAHAYINCKDGSKLATHEDRFFAIVGETIHANVGEPATDPAYGDAYRACLG